MSMKPSAPLKPASRVLPAAIAAAVLMASLLPAPMALAQNAKARTTRGETVTLNFVNAEIEGVARAMSAILKQPFVVDPRVKGTMTLYSDAALTPREAYVNFLAALRGLGFTVVEVGGLYKIVPEADAKLQTGTVAVGGSTARGGDQVLTQVFRLQHENANNLVPVLRPLISPNNTINANPGNNTLVITDYADNLQRIGKIISAMDTPASGDVEVIALRYAVAADIAPLVQRMTDSTGATGGGVPTAPGAPGSTTASSVQIDSRSNSLLVRAPNPARMASIRALIDKLDRPVASAGATGNVWVVYLKNADAVKLATVLRAAYGGSGGSSGSSGSTGSSALATPTSTAVNAGTGASGGSTQNTTPLAASGGPATGGFVQADPSSNALIITAPEPFYRQLRAVIDQLDTRRAQVYIESLIVEVDPSQTADLGIQWQGLIGGKGDTNVIGLGTNFGAGLNNILTGTAAIANGSAGLATAIGSGLPSAGLNIGLAHKIGNYYTLGALAQALNTTSGTNILSTPNLVTLDNEEARIVVGQNVPFVTGQYTNTGTATSSPFQTIERKDVGTTLKIKPQIGENGTIRMTIYQESSSIGSVATGTTGAGPTTNKRSIESTVVVDDGQIIVLGGLIEDTVTVDQSKVPLLGDIPYVGALFRSESRSRKKTNLMVFLRPVVMRDQAATDRISLDRYDYIRAQQQQAQPPANAIMGVNESAILRPIRPEDVSPNGVPPPLGDTGPLRLAPPRPASAPPVLAPSLPASAPTTN
ncbi:MAG: type II secretion system secretin GspD [Pseudomonadota bacterium]